MSKVDALRALREAKYAASRKTSSDPAPRPAARPAPAAAKAAPRSAPAVSAPGTAEELCGHRNMSGRSCTREAGHQAAGTKNHRYG